MDPHYKQYQVYDQAYKLVIRIWAAFDACDVDKSNSIDENELQFLLYCYEKYKPTKERVHLFMQDIGVKDHISRI
jgi:hypothetical protein